MLTVIAIIAAAIAYLADIDIDIDAILTPAVAAAGLTSTAWTRIARELAANETACRAAIAAVDPAESYILHDEYTALVMEIEDAGETVATVTAPVLSHPVPQHYLGGLNPYYDNK